MTAATATMTSFDDGLDLDECGTVRDEMLAGNEANVEGEDGGVGGGGGGEG